MKKLLFTTLLLMGAAQAQKATTVRLGFFPNLTHAAALVGLEKGYFQKELGNVKLTAKEFIAGTALNEAFAAGEIDIGYIGPGPAINGAVRGLPMQIIAGASNAGAVLVARKGSGIQSYKDLAGKKVAVPALGNTQDISLRHILKQEGLTGKVTVQALPPHDAATAFSIKQLDAALVPEPWGALLESKGNVVIGTEKTVWRNGDYPTTLVVVNTKFAKENPDLVKAFLKGHLKAVTFIQKNGPAAQASISKKLQELTRETVDPRVLQRALKRTTITVNYSLDALKEYAALNRESGYIRNLPDWNTLINTSYLNEVK